MHVEIANNVVIVIAFLLLIASVVHLATQLVVQRRTIAKLEAMLYLTVRRQGMHEAVLMQQLHVAFPPFATEQAPDPEKDHLS